MHLDLTSRKQITLARPARAAKTSCAFGLVLVLGVLLGGVLPPCTAHDEAPHPCACCSNGRACTCGPDASCGCRPEVPSGPDTSAIPFSLVPPLALRAAVPAPLLSARSAGFARIARLRFLVRAPDSPPPKRAGSCFG
jgi:hypothetical protein